MRSLILSVSLSMIAFFSFTHSTMGQETVYPWKVDLGVNQFWGGSVHFVEGKLSVDNAMSYNVGFARRVSPSRYVGLDYSFVSTDLGFDPNIYYSGELNSGEAPLDIHFVELEATQYFPAGGGVSPFFDAGIGMAIYDITEGNIDGRTHLLIDLGLGADIDFTNQLGLKLRGGLKMPMYNGGAGLYCGIGGHSGANCGLSFDSSVLITHWELGAALCYKI